MDKSAGRTRRSGVCNRILMVVARIGLSIRSAVPLVGIRAGVVALDSLQRAAGEGAEQSTQECDASEHAGEVTSRRGEKATRMRPSPARYANA
jgi:hypothetical protein